MARGSAGESVLHKHLRVLDCFDAWHPTLSLTEIIAIADLSPSTAHRLVAELTHEGLLERLPDRRYRLGAQLWEYASRAPGTVGLREIARPWLAALHARVRQHAQVGVRVGHEVLFVDRLSDEQAVVNGVVIGGRIPVHVSAVGLCLLAFADPEVVDEVAGAKLKSFTPHTITTERELRAVLARVRETEFAETCGHVSAESRGIAVPVRGEGGTVVAGLGVVVENDGTSPLPYVDLLRRAAGGVSRDLRDSYDPDAPELSPGVQPLAGRQRDVLDLTKKVAVSGRRPTPYSAEAV